MSYLVLARKWRPQTFSDLTGQEHVSRTLRNAIDSGRVAHAFLFTGARGVGKTSSARILAKALTCEQGMSPEPCNVCPACLEITGGTSVDVQEIDGASNTGVDDIRELRETVKYLPSRLRFKIYIIDEVHMLTTNAFNALLKTLEEPPPHVKFIFATTEPHKLPITILSRCQRFDFKRIPLPKLVARLRFIVDQEGVAISDVALSVIGRKGDGSMRDSLSILDQVLAFCGERIDDEEVISLLGVVDRRMLLETSAAVFAADSRAVLDIVRRVDEFGYNMRQFCQELIAHFRNLAILRAVKEANDLLDLSEAELSELRGQAKGRELAELQRHLSILLKADTEMAQSSFPRLCLEMALIKMANLAPVMPVNEILAQLKQLEGRVQTGTAAEPQPQWSASPAVAPAPRRSPEPQESRPAPAPERSAPAAPQRPQRTGNDWADLVAFVKGRKVALGSLLEHASPLSISAERLEIGFPEGSFHLSRIKDPEATGAFRDMTAEFFGAAPAIVFVPMTGDGDKAPQSLLEKKKADEQLEMNTLRQQTLGNPVVAAALEIFGGEIAEIGVVEKKQENPV